MNAADAFREIDSDTIEAIRGLDMDGDGSQDVLGYLVGVRAAIQDAIPTAEADARKLAAASMMADFIATWKDALAGTAMSVQDFNETSGLKEYNAAVAKALKPDTGEPT